MYLGNKNMNNVITVDLFNKLTGQETLHPLVGLADLSDDKLSEDLRMPCNFYALICRPDESGDRASLRLVNPGEMFEIPAAFHCNTKGYTGVIFHPDLLTYRERELATVSILAGVGGVEPMAYGHMGICLHLGITSEQLTALLNIVETNLGPASATPLREVLKNLTTKE